MLFIGYYYADTGLYYLYKASSKKPNWVSNICYYDSYTNRLYSPNMRNLAQNGRDADGIKHAEHFWKKFITDTHDSFVFI